MNSKPFRSNDFFLWSNFASIEIIVDSSRSLSLDDVLDDFRSEFFFLSLEGSAFPLSHWPETESHHLSLRPETY